MANWSDCSAVERHPHIVSGVWVFHGTRVPIRALFENLRDGSSIEEVIEWFPNVTREQIETVLDFEARSLLESVA